MAKVKDKKPVVIVKPEKDLFENIWICMGILFVFWLIFFSQILTGKAFLWDDFAQQYYPGKTLAAATLNSGEFPFWNPYTFSGMPFFADLQIAILYPFNYIFRFFVNGDHLSPVLIQFTIVLHYFLCSIFSFFLGKQLKFSNLSSLALAILFTYSSYMMIHMIHMPLIEAVIWFPLIFLLWMKFVDNKKYIYVILAGVSMTMCILSGYPQVAFFIYLFIAIFILIIFVSRFRKKDYKGLINISAGFLSFLIIPFGIAAIQLLPANEFVSYSNRATFDYDFAKQGSVYFVDFVTFIVPKVFGVWTENASSTDLKYWTKHSEGIFMFSISNIFISVLAVVILIPVIIYILRKKENIIINGLLIGFIIFSLLFALGGNFFLHKLLFDTLPVFNRFRNPGHILFLFTFSGSILISYGIDLIVRRQKNILALFSIKYFLILISVFAFILILVLSGSFNPADIQNKEIASWISKQYVTFFILLLLFSGLIYFFLNNKIKKNVFSILLIFLLLAEIYYIWYDLNNGSNNPEKILSQNSQDVKKLKEELKNEYFRVSMRKYFPEGGSYSHFQRNQGMIDRIPLIEGYGALLLNRMYPINKRGESSQNHDLMNIKYDISVDKNKKTAAFILNPGYLPRTKMFYDIKVIENDSVSLRKYMESNEYDYQKTLVLEKNPGNIKLPVITDSLNNPKYNVKITDYKNDKITIEVETSDNGFLFLSEIYYPAWKAFIDGKETEIFRTDFSMRSIYVEKGNHNIEFIYGSNTYQTGKSVSVIVLSLTIISIIVFGVRLRKKEDVIKKNETTD